MEKKLAGLTEEVVQKEEQRALQQVQAEHQRQDAESNFEAELLGVQKNFECEIDFHNRNAKKLARKKRLDFEWVSGELRKLKSEVREVSARVGAEVSQFEHTVLLPSMKALQAQGTIGGRAITCVIILGKSLDRNHITNPKQDDLVAKPQTLSSNRVPSGIPEGTRFDESVCVLVSSDVKPSKVMSTLWSQQHVLYVDAIKQRVGGRPPRNGAWEYDPHDVVPPRQESFHIITARRTLR